MSDNQETKKVSCDGSVSRDNKDYADNKHPLIYLKITRGTNTDCPYCGKVFTYEDL